MKNLHLEKKGLRGLGIAESFSQNSQKSILSGVAMRRDFVIDGFVFGNATLSGDDATDEILKMYKKLDRQDISYIMISGIIISLYNMIDIKRIHDALEIPVVAVKEILPIVEPHVTVLEYFPATSGSLKAVLFEKVCIPPF